MGMRLLLHLAHVELVHQVQRLGHAYGRHIDQNAEVARQPEACPADPCQSSTCRVGIRAASSADQSAPL